MGYRNPYFLPGAGRAVEQEHYITGTKPLEWTGEMARMEPSLQQNGKVN